jgi:hypothetical protein
MQFPLLLQTLAFFMMSEGKKDGRKGRTTEFRNENTYWERDVPGYSNNKLKEQFRLDRSTFKFIHDLLLPHHKEPENTGRPDKCTLDKQLAIFLYRTKEGSISYRTLGSVFGIGTQTARNSLINVARMISVHLKDRFIHFPSSEEEWRTSRAAFSRLSKGLFNHAAGLIDGVHYPIHEPPFAEDSNDTYRNRKGWTSINCMAVTNARKMFIYLEARWPGSLNDRRLVSNSPLRQLHFIPDGMYLIGDSGFTLHNKLLCPFTGVRSADEFQFNHLLSKTRISVEHTFGIWKARFRCLLYDVYSKPELAAEIITATAVMHNICQLQSDKVWKSWLNDVKAAEDEDDIDPAIDVTE